MPPLPEIATESFKGHVGRRLEVILETRGSRRRESSAFRTSRGEKEDNMDTSGLGANRGEGLSRIATPTAQI